MSDIWADLTWRGLVADSTDPDALRRVLLAGPVKFYVGFLTSPLRACTSDTSSSS